MPRDEERSDQERPHDGALLRYAVLLTGSRADAEDLIQESWAKCYEHCRRNPTTEIRDEKAFMRKVVTTTFISGRRRASAWRLRLPLLLTPAFDLDTQDRIAARDQLMRALASLPARQRTATVLRYYQDLTFGEVALTLGCSEATARNLVSRALKRLRIQLEDGA